MFLNPGFSVRVSGIMNYGGRYIRASSVLYINNKMKKEVGMLLKTFLATLHLLLVVIVTP